MLGSAPNPQSLVGAWASQDPSLFLLPDSSLSLSWVEAPPAG